VRTATDANDPTAANKSRRTALCWSARRDERAPAATTAAAPLTLARALAFSRSESGVIVLALGAVDRLIHHAELISLESDSYRLKDRDLGPRPTRRGDTA
jgi:hypothetical protein